MRRNEWTFEMPANQIAEAAVAKLKHHEQRLAFWKKAEAEVMADVKDKGLSVETSLAGDNYSNKSRAYGPQIVIDDIFHRRLNEAAEKIREHTDKVAEYDGWVQVLTAHKDRSFPLNADDYLYFFSK
jgi:hypothetical protein